MDLKNSLNIKKLPFKRKYLAEIPEEPGVYIFWSGNIPLYVGKSVNLRNRIKSYKSVKLIGKTAAMISQVSDFSFIIVLSEIESLLLEAKLVKLFYPPYNIQLKDDKHPLYIRITNDTYPIVMTARKTDRKAKDLDFFGPYPSTSNVRKTLSIIRKIFPFSHHLPSNRACLYHQMGLCNPCPSKVEKIKNPPLIRKTRSLYIRNIRYIRDFLNGKVRKIEKDLRRKMDNYIKLELFENADRVKSQINAIKYVTSFSTPVSYFIENPNFAEDLKKNEIRKLKTIIGNILPINKLERIECYDVAHLSGTYPTASMVTFIKGSPEKKLYRHFKIRQKNSRDDLSNLAEIAKRRFKHLEDWGKPDLIIVDGGRAQVGSFLKVFVNTKIPIVGIAKKEEVLIIPDIKNKIIRQIKLKKDPALYLVQRMRDEAHRFSRKLHHRLISRKYLYNEDNK